jgi:hypothetical protein
MARGHSVRPSQTGTEARGCKGSSWFTSEAAAIKGWITLQTMVTRECVQQDWATPSRVGFQGHHLSWGMQDAVLVQIQFMYTMSSSLTATTKTSFASKEFNSVNIEINKY